MAAIVRSVTATVRSEPAGAGTKYKVRIPINKS